jgi:23S rRNA (cytidine1920-2'-O)/16S rRNA (cytidine1409-2'-O)-methyltransferase
VPSARRRRFVALVDLLAQRRPDVAVSVIHEARVLVEGRFVTNPRAQVPADASLRVLPARRLRGDVKLSHALDNLHGFTSALLDRGALRVYAVDVGVGQLVGRLPNDPRVVNLEGHNLATLDRALVPDVVGLTTMDLSYLAVSDALPQLAGLDLETHADLVALVKPTFELHAATLARSNEDVSRAIEHVQRAMVSLGWHVRGRCDAPATGRRGAREAFVHGRREPHA